MRDLLRRIVGSFVLLWLVVSATFALTRLAPGDPAAMLVPPTASASESARLRAELGLDAPAAEQYARWIARTLRGDLGESFQTRRPVTAALRDALPVSLWLGGTSLLLTFVIGVAIGTLQAARRGGALDATLTVATTTVYAAPSFWIALTLIAVFTYGASVWGFPAGLRLPAFGVRDPALEATGLAGAMDLMRHSVLPVTVLASIGAAGIARYARSSVADLARAEWARTAQAKGLSSASVFARHVLPNALAPLVVLLALSLPGIVAGSVFVESVFAWPGMGRLMVQAIAARDYPVIMGATILYAALVIAANLAADIALPLLDPRRRA